MTHLNEQREFANGLFAAARQVMREINAEAMERHAKRPKPTPPVREPEPPHADDFDFEPPTTCQCGVPGACPPCSWCTSDDNPLNAEGDQT